MKQRIVLLGPPASGKGTQTELIRQHFGIPSTSPGEMLRKERAAGTQLGMEADKLTSSGQLLPDEIIVSLVSAWLTANDSVFIFDGFPRTLGQAEALSSLLEQRGTPLQATISLDADFETIKQRVTHRVVCGKCGAIFSIGLHVQSADEPCPRCAGPLKRRRDDNLTTLETRMDEYREKSEPLISYYGERGILHVIDANRTPDEVFSDIAAVIA